MSRRTTSILKAALAAMYFTGSHKLLAPFTRGVGIIFMLHNVSPEPPRSFEPNRILRVRPRFLEEVILQTLEAGFDIVSLDEVHWRLCEGEFERPFACFTFDDGYRDNLEYAYPIFRKYDLPMAVYVPSDYADGAGDLWWLALEKVVAEVDALRVRMDGALRTFSAASPAEKARAFHRIYWWLRRLDEDDARQVVRELCRGIGFNPDELCAERILDWEGLRTLAGTPQVTIGAHGRGHYALAKLPLARARQEMEGDLDRLERELGRRPEHFSFPYGDPTSAGPREFELARELGLKTAVTTRKGVVYAEHCDHLTALPRVSLNGDYQSAIYTSVFLTGAPFALSNRFRKLDVA